MLTRKKFNFAYSPGVTNEVAFTKTLKKFFPHVLIVSIRILIDCRFYFF